MRVAVIGAGIVGLATARAIQRAHGAELVVFEAENAVAAHQTGHNSGVVHAGIYYAPGSLKARLCRRGIGMLRDFCAERQIAYQACGKLVVATEEHERGRLEKLAERAASNGVDGLAWLEGEEMRQVEPRVSGVCALHSPSTAIADFVGVARSLAASVAAHGGEIKTGAAVRRVRREGSRARVELVDSAFEADRVVVCAGLQADRLARLSGRSPDPRIIPFRGEYWKLRQDRTDLVKGLIYPVPDPALPFLGVHVTRRFDGEVWLGPNAVLALALHGYRRRQVSPTDIRHILGWPGTWRLMAGNWRAGLRELRSKRTFINEAQRFLPELRRDEVLRAPSGVRAQAVGRDGSMVDDFRIDRDGGVLWVRNAPSPAATSSLAIAEELLQWL